jgi:hypothetical protein
MGALSSSPLAVECAPALHFAARNQWFGSALGGPLRDGEAAVGTRCLLTGADGSTAARGQRAYATGKVDGGESRDDRDADRWERRGTDERSQPPQVCAIVVVGVAREGAAN